MPNSQNGWPANDITLTKVWTIPGTTRTIRLEKGDAGYLLTDFLAWFHVSVEPIDLGIFDDWGYAERPIRGSTTTLSNHASGTGADVNATRHPLGVENTFLVWQREAIRKKLKDYDGCIRWGGDYTGRKDDMHFEINRSHTVVALVAMRLKEDELSPAFESEARAWFDSYRRKYDAMENDLRGDLAIKGREIKELNSKLSAILEILSNPPA